MLRHTKNLLKLSKLRFSTSKTLYQILEVEPEVPQLEIRKAYLLKAKALHPDLIEEKTDTANAQFQEVVDAYQTLKIPHLRKAYDRNLKRGVNEKPENQNAFGGREAKAFYDNQWYGFRPPKEDLRFEEDYTKEYNEFVFGKENKSWLEKRLGYARYKTLRSARIMFLGLVVLLFGFEFWFLRKYEKEDRM